MSVFAAKVYTITELERREISEALAHAAATLGAVDTWSYDVIHMAREILQALPARVADTDEKLIEFLMAEQAKYLEGLNGRPPFYT